MVSAVVIEDQTKDLMLLDDVVRKSLGILYFYVLKKRGGEFFYQFILADDRHLHQYLIEQVEVDDGRGLHHFLHTFSLVEDDLPATLVAITNLKTNLLEVHEYLSTDDVAEPLRVWGQLRSLS